MKYFAHLNHTYTAKNKAHQDIQDYAISVDGTFLNSDQAKKQFKAAFKEKLFQVNLFHKRCQDIQFSGFYFGHNEHITVDGNFSISIFPVKNEIS